MKNIKLLNGDEFKVSDIIPKMYDDVFTMAT